MTTIYDFTMTLDDGSQQPLAAYRGKTLLVVNTATKCGFAPQFSELEDLYQRYHDEGLVVLGFPSNQFKQELSSSAAAAEACRTTYGVSFPMSQLIAVNGPETDPIFHYLKQQAPTSLGRSIKWNFTKFLVHPDGITVERFAPKTSPKKMVGEIVAALAEVSPATIK
ncbi:MAG: glutathione peroxidase [Lactobacillus sp.]